MATSATGRIRVHQLAKELGLSSRELLARLAADGIEAGSAQASVSAEVADRLRSASGTAPASAPAEAPSAPPAPVALFQAPPASEPSRPAKKQAKKAAPAKKATKAQKAPAVEPTAADQPGTDQPAADQSAAPAKKQAKKAAKKSPAKAATAAAESTTEAEPTADAPDSPDDVREAAAEEATGARRRRRRGRRGRGGRSNANAEQADTESPADAAAEAGEAVDDSADEPETEAADEGGSAATRRRRRRRRAGSNDAEASADDPSDTVVHVREARAKERSKGRDSDDDGVRGVKGSTRLEAKRQRRRDGRDSGRRRPPILSEAEFLARREAVDRVMAVRQHGDRTQIAVLEDDMLVEHYVTQASSSSSVGNIYLGRVQNVLPSMEAAFIDIGKGRNGVLYAGEVNWEAAGLEGKARAIEDALKSGDTVLVQVTKDPIGHKGARLTSQISLPGRFLVYVPGGGMTGISRKLPDTERQRLKSILKKAVPEDAGVIIRTAAEGASEEDITRDVERLQAQWEKIQKTAEKAKSAPMLAHGEPDLAIRVVRDVFNEDFKKLTVQGDAAWRTVSEYVESVAPELAERTAKYTGTGDLFHDLRIDEQLMKALDRKVWLPSGGSLVIDRTEAMVVIDVNTGKFVGSGGNLEETVTRNNLEAAEEIVRQLRLRDVGGIIVIDFIDMVLESNRELVLRRLTECLGRDRTKHQVAEVTSLGLVQMTRKRVGEGLLEAFSEPCPHCNGRGVIVHADPVERSSGGSAPAAEDNGTNGRNKRKRGGKKAAEREPAEPPVTEEQRQARLAAINAIHKAAHGSEDDDATATPDQVAQFDDAAAELEMAAVAAVLDSVPVDPEPSADGATNEPTPEAEAVSAPAPRRRRRGASRPAGPPAPVSS